jgi:hypothetical protein
MKTRKVASWHMKIMFIPVINPIMYSWICFKFVLFTKTLINPLKTKRICFIQGLSAYRAVNSLHFGYKNLSLNIL